MDLRKFSSRHRLRHRRGHDIGENTISGVLIATNAGLLLAMIKSTDRVRRIHNKKNVRIMNRVLEEEEKEDKHKYDAAYAEYVADAPEGAEARLFEQLAAKKTET